MSLDFQTSVRFTAEHIRIIDDAVTKYPGKYRNRNEFIRRLVEDYEERTSKLSEADTDTAVSAS